MESGKLEQAIRKIEIHIFDPTRAHILHASYVHQANVDAIVFVSSGQILYRSS